MIKFEAVISIKRVKDSFYPSEKFTFSLGDGNPEIVETCFKKMSNKFINSPHQ